MSSTTAIMGSVLGGLVTPLVVIVLSSLLVPRLRQRQHVRAKKEAVELQFKLIATKPASEPSQASTEDREISRLFRENHQASITLQNETMIDVIAASATFFVAFVASAAAATILARYPAVRAFAAFLDLAALLAVVLLFRASGRTRSAWLRWRIVTEMVRHWALTRGLLPTGAASASEAFSTRAEEARAKLPMGDSDLPAAAARQGGHSLEILDKQLSDAPSLEGSRVKLYVDQRVGGQSAWFTRSANRMARQERQRRALMAGLFLLCVAAAVIEALSVLGEAEKIGELAALAVLVAIGLAGASTSAYVAQNSRSLKHRYETQLRWIEHWIEQHRALMEAASQAPRVNGVQKRQVVTAIVAFERMMMDELVDWLSISIDDAMELAPG